jgi:NAD(P)H-hydrate epimerase
MSVVLTSAQMKEMDRRCIEDFGLPARILMENAGNACAGHILESYPEIFAQGVMIFHGCGNNSGDGFVIARKLYMEGINVKLIKVHDSPFTPESKANYQLCEKLKIPMLNYSKKTEDKDWAELALHADVVIDAVFGIGFHGELPDAVKMAFGYTMPVCKTRIAIDIPSGVNADTGSCAEGAFMATETLCIQSMKFGHLLSQGRIYSGMLTEIDIGIPSEYMDDIFQLHVDEDTEMLPDRYPFANKGNYGRVLLIGGSVGFSGSIALAAMAALRSGAGYCVLMSRPEMAEHYYHLSPEIMFKAVPVISDSGLPDKNKLVEILKTADSVVIGCGLGLDEYALSLLRIVLEHCTVPVIVDADAITLIANNPDLTRLLDNENILLTPHMGEFSRLCKINVNSITADTMSALKKYVKKTHAQVLLKSHTTIYCEESLVLINTSGNDGLATGGSGDVLAGIIGSFAAQHMEVPFAAIGASYVMGKTAEELAQKRAPISIIPSDIINNLFVYPRRDNE